jgi:N-acetyl-anhydromuramyl-L-alanine amidase AmpD
VLFNNLGGYNQADRAICCLHTCLSPVMPTKTIRVSRKRAHAFRKGRTIDGQAVEIKNIVLHSSDGREAGDIATLTSDDVSSHYYVTRSGKIFRLVDDADTAFHAGRVTRKKFFSNAVTIGIEQEHFDPDPGAGRPNNEDWPEEQLEKVAQLVAFLCQEHGLNAPEDIKTHAQIAAPPGRKQDPFGYPMNHFTSLVATNREFQWKVQEV